MTELPESAMQDDTRISFFYTPTGSRYESIQSVVSLRLVRLGAAASRVRFHVYQR